MVSGPKIAGILAACWLAAALALPALAAPSNGNGGHGGGRGHGGTQAAPDLRRPPYPTHHPILGAMGHHA